MTEITNADRAAWASEAVALHADLTNSVSEDLPTQVGDLITNMIHLLRLDCSYTYNEAEMVAQLALSMAQQEQDEDPEY